MKDVSDEYKAVLSNANAFIDSLSPEQQVMFDKLMEDYVNYENEIDAITS